MLDEARQDISASWSQPIRDRLPTSLVPPARRSLRVLVVVSSLVVTTVVSIALVATALGYDLFVINGGSMAPSVPPGSLVIAERVAPARVQAGDVVTFRRSSAPNSPVTHRVVLVEQSDAGTVLWTKGDANDSIDAEPLAGSEPISLVRVSLPLAGYILGFLRTLPGQVLLVIAPVLVMLVRAMTGGGSARGSVVSSQSQPRTQASSSRIGLSGVSALRTRVRAQLQSLAHLRPLRWPVSSSALRPQHTAYEHRSSDRTARLRAAVEEPARITSEFSTLLNHALDPVERLAARIAARSEDIERALDVAMRPMTEYAEQVEVNLARLEASLRAMNVPAGSPLALQAVAERTRLRDVRHAIDEAKEPLRASIRREEQALDAALAPFDAEVSSVEMLLRQQRRHLVKVLAGLQSDQFRVAVGVLERRNEELGVLASLGSLNESEVGAVLSISAAERADLAASSPYLAAALAMLTSELDSNESTPGRDAAA